jgi:NAD(P)-dependent dehydrogenase (short-subunit alcohol dehydrogenase family)
MSKTVLITGVTSGIGKITALELAKQKFRVVFTSRNMQKGEQVKQEIIQESGNSEVEVMECDLSSFESIQNFTQNFKSKYDQLDVLINNAGVWETQRKETKEGIEAIFGVNHLAPFLLTNLLLETIKKTPNSRIVNVASSLHVGVIDFDDLEGKKSFSWRKAYTQSKLANILFTKKLARILEGTGITVNCLHPGFIQTDLFRNQPGFVRFVMKFMQITPQEGAKTTLYLATSDEVKNVTGEYFAKSKIANSGEYSKRPEIADKLWDVSLEYTKKFI